MSLHNDSASKMFAQGGLRPVVINSNTTTNGFAADTADFGSLTWVFDLGIVVDGAYQLLLEESDTGAFAGEETVVPDADIVDGVVADWNFAPGDGLSGYRVGIVAKKQFQRASLVSTGITVGGTFSWVGILGHPKSQPPTSQKPA